MAGKIDHPEWRLSRYVDKLLDRILTEPCWFSAVERAAIPRGETSEEQRQKNLRWQESLKARGVKTHLDWYAYQVDTGIYTQFELKYGTNKARGVQDGVVTALENRGIPTGIFWTLREVYDHIKACGFALHGNAENIFVEMEARWLAADEAKRGGQLKTKRSSRPSRPRAQKPTAGQVARRHRMTRMPL